MADLKYERSGNTGSLVVFGKNALNCPFIQLHDYEHSLSTV
jgi:hypothetical protein